MNIKLLSLLSILFFSSCFNIAGNPGKKGNGKIVSTEVSISDYSRINGSGVVNIIYEQDDSKAPYLRYEIDENLVEYISINNDGQSLIVKATESLNSNKFKVYTNSKQLSSIDLSGNSNINIKSELNGDQLNLNLSGASDIFANNKITVNEFSVKASGASDIIASQIKATNTSIYVSGSSDAKLSGSTDTLLIEASGASDVIADKLQSKIADVRTSGSSDVSLFVTEELKAKSSGSSDIRYHGSPKSKSVSSSGSSDIESK